MELLVELQKDVDTTIQKEFRQYILDAHLARDADLNYQKYAKRYSLKDKDFPESETDNAKYYYIKVKEDVKTSGQNAQLSADSAAVSTTQAGIASTKAAAATVAADVITTTNKANGAAASEHVAREKAAEAYIYQTGCKKVKDYPVGREEVEIKEKDEEDRPIIEYQEVKETVKLTKE